MFPGLTTRMSEGPVITTAASITQTADVHRLTGTTSIATIVPPPNFGPDSGILVLIPTGGDVATLTTGNISLAVTMTNKKAQLFVWSKSAGLWYPRN